MRNILLMFILTIVCTGTLMAQEASFVFHPGDPVHILVTFKTPPAPFEGGSFTFNLIGQPDKAQELLNGGFSGNQVHKISDTEYEISGTISEHMVSGRYNLTRINVAITGVGKQYSAGTDFKELTLTIVNPEHPEFPAIGDVKLEPRK